MHYFTVIAGSKARGSIRLPSGPAVKLVCVG